MSVGGIQIRMIFKTIKIIVTDIGIIRSLKIYETKRVNDSYLPLFYIIMLSEYYSIY